MPPDPLDLRRPLADLSLEERLRLVISRPTSVSSAGYPYLEPVAFRFLRDRVPLLFAMGDTVLGLLRRLSDEATERDDESALQALKVVRQVVFTAAITAPPDLWLVRNVLCILHQHGLIEPLLEGATVYPDAVGPSGPLDPHQLRIAFDLLTARGLVEPWDDGVRIAGHRRATDVLALGASSVPVSATGLWREALDGAVPPVLLAMPAVEARTDPSQPHWIATAGEVETAHQLVPLVLALRSHDLTTGLSRGDSFPAVFADSAITAKARSILVAAGWLSSEGLITGLGARGFRRGPGPFGIIETYHPYLSAADALFRGEPAPSWVERGENVAASQDANRATFVKANDQLDRFCEDTGFRYDVFVEHAVGKGEATRIRYARDGDRLAYLGADLEDAAIDAAIGEQADGNLPASMTFVRHADIGRPQAVLQALQARGLDPARTVMMVGNGFHEVRGQTDASMVEVFRGYADAGIVLIFTEENALSSDDIRQTAWNTYHAAFRYVHALSGQGLRPAMRRPPTRSGHLLPTAWTECGEAAGYVPLAAYTYRSRTIFPTPNADGHNPSISVTHFFVPRALAQALGLDTDGAAAS